MKNFSKNDKSMEELIRKYQEEAMQYKQRSTDLYREEIPAKETAAEPKPVGEEKEPAENTDLPYVSKTETEDSNPLPDELIKESEPEELGDVLYAPGPVTPEELAAKSRYVPQQVPYTDEGELQIEVSAASRSLPIPFTDIMVVRQTEEGSRLVRQMQTDDSGNSPVVKIPAPPRSLSDSPNQEQIPYGIYTVAVSHPEYYTTIVRDVQVFAGQRALLPVALIPLSEQSFHPGAPNRTIETGDHSLTE